MPETEEGGFLPSPDLFPFESRWFDSTAGRIHYVDEGAGQPILMLHGNPTWSFLYRNVIKELKDRFRCIALDYPGFGLSDRPAGYGYTPGEHAVVVAELVRALDLREMIVLGHDWGGPIGLSVASSDPDRIAGLALGNTWFWPPDLSMRMFSRAMSSRPMQRAIRERNFFVERIIPAGTARDLSDKEMTHYRAVQPTPAARAGVAEFPRQIIGASAWLRDLAGAVPRELGDRRTLVTWPMKDLAFRAGKLLPRFRLTFSDLQILELTEAKHYFVEDAPRDVARALSERFA